MENPANFDNTPYGKACRERHDMWCKIILGYAGLSRWGKKKTKAAYCKAFGLAPSLFKPYEENTMSDFSIPSANGEIVSFTSVTKLFDDCAESANIPQPMASAQGCVNKTKKGNTMHYVEISPEKDRLLSRARDIYSQKDQQARKDFHMDDDTAPSTPEELIERITTGKYALIPEKDRRSYWSAMNCIKWRDPKFPADKDGYTAAEEKLDKLYDAAKDEIIVYDPEKALASLRAFESATLH